MKEHTLTNPSGEHIEFAYHPGTRKEALILIGHGVTGNMDRFTSVGLSEGLSALGWNCLRFSFSGNGNSDGDFKEATITKEVEDLKALIDQLTEEGRKIIYIGHSMGGAVGVKTAAQDSRIHALVNMAGMIRTEKFCTTEFGHVTPEEGTMWDEEECPLSQSFVDDLTQIDTLFPCLATLRCPIFFLHGTADDVVLPEDSTDGYDQVSSNHKKILLLDGEGHTFSEAGMKTASTAIHQWLQELPL